MRLIEFRFYVHPDTKYRSFRRRSSPPVCRLSTAKLNLSQQKQQKQNILQLKINTKTPKPGLVASYDLRPGNGTGLFFRK